MRRKGEKGLEEKDVIYVSEGLSLEEKERFGFKHAESVEEALEAALRKQAKIEVIDYGGDAVPKLE